MMIKPKQSAAGTLFAKPRTFVARLILAEALAKRGEGALRRKHLIYAPRKR